MRIMIFARLATIIIFFLGISLWKAHGAGSVHLTEVQIAPAADVQKMPTVRIYFDHDSAALTDSGRQLVDSIISLDSIISNGDRTILIVGNTDASYGDSESRQLGQRRAEAVRKALEDNGVSGSRIKIVNYGKARPQVSAPTGIHVPQNERVDVFENNNGLAE
jgi:outer membrane protein OmpA-like peptidoglycan-associated protein